MKTFMDLRIPSKVLIVGKGPSYEKFDSIKNDYFSIGINEVRGTNINHMIDWEVMDFSCPTILAPFEPLLHRQPYQEKIPDLPHVYGYNFYTAKKKYGLTPTIYNDQFSIHCILEILGMRGVRDIKLLGIDRGHDYHGKFEHLDPRPEGYEQQWKRISEIKDKYSMRIECL